MTSPNDHYIEDGAFRGYVCKEDYHAYIDWWQHYRDRGCACSQSGLCGFCCHPGNPINLCNNYDESNPVEPIVDYMEITRKICGG